MNNKYSILIEILDKIRFEAPTEYKSYLVENNEELINQSRSKAFIHLYLLVNFGLTNFETRHDHITDGADDGGLDAYYIDEKRKKIFLIQSKFRNNPRNFEEKSITADELVKMELKTIIDGHKKDSNGNKFNNKIQKFQSKINSIGNIGIYDYQVVILSNITKYNDSHIKKLIGNFEYEIFNFEKTYSDLIFPICSGTLFDPKEIIINIDLKEKPQLNLNQKIETSYGACNVDLIFAPTMEIGRIMSKYKNSILKYNPRNYLSFSKNRVNVKIKESIINGNKNDFSILNNGITIITDNIKISTHTGSENEGQIILYNPQIINGGQTAFTLSYIFEDKNVNNIVFEGKEVLLRIVRMGRNGNNHVNFLEKVSESTNNQTKVDEADKRSNDPIQIELQNKIYKEYGYFYERKSGEFFDGLHKMYIKKDLIIDRSKFLRGYHAYKGFAKDARSKSDDDLFKEENFKKIIPSSFNYKEMFFSYSIYNKCQYLKRKAPFNKLQSSLKYGKYALVAATGCYIKKKLLIIDPVDDKKIENACKAVLKKWENFERKIRRKISNKSYRTEKKGFDFDNYYKGTTLDKDINEYFG
jgi:hypothetical protein